jgi:uncharacterized membrane protein
MGSVFWLLVLASIGTAALSYRRAAAAEEKVHRVLRELQKLGEELGHVEGSLKQSVEELRREIHAQVASTRK